MKSHKIADHLKRQQKQAARQIQRHYGVSYNACLNQVRLHTGAGYTLVELARVFESVRQYDFNTFIKVLKAVRAGTIDPLEGIDPSGLDLDS